MSRLVDQYNQLEIDASIVELQITRLRAQLNRIREQQHKLTASPDWTEDDEREATISW